MYRSLSITELAKALAKAQGEMENAKRGSLNPHFKSTYADLATIWNVIREPFSNNGLSVVQIPSETASGSIRLTTTLMHSSGEFIEECFSLSLKDASNPQQAGSALTYMKRYALLGVAGIAPEDDDGNAATGKPSPAQPAQDYTQTINDTMEELKRCSPAEARALYATVRNSGMQQASRDALLIKMATYISNNMKETQ